MDKRIGDSKRFIAKQSFSVFDRALIYLSYTFAGVDYNAYTDVSYVTNGEKHAFVLGGNFIYNKFNKTDQNPIDLNNTSTTGGLYGQHTWDASDKLKLETGLRVDVANYKNVVYTNTEVFVLPRVSLLVNYSSKWTSRIGGRNGL